ncbi:MAG TPA: DMT family transporter [Ktedonobacterales bacterium]
MKRETAVGLLQINVATILFGLAGVLGKVSGLPAPLITLGRVVFGGITLALFAGVTRPQVRPQSRRDAFLLLAQGLILAVHWTAFFESIAVSSVAIGLLSFSSFPLFTAVLEPLLLSQRPRRIEVVAAALILVGVYVLAPNLSLSNGVTQGVVWGLGAGATFALLSVINRGLVRRYPAVTVSLYQDGVAAVALLPSLLFFPVSGALTIRGLSSLVTLGVLCTALAHTLFVAGLRQTRAQTASLIAALEPVWGILFALVLVAEAPSARTLVGGVIIVAATLLPGLLPERPEARARPADTTNG